MCDLEAEDETELVPSVVAFQEHVTTDACLRVAHLMVHLDRNSPDSICLHTAIFLGLARALHSVITITVDGTIIGPDDLFAGLAACCPHLRTLKVGLPVVSPKIVASLSALRSLTSLKLVEEFEDNPWLGSLDNAYRDYPQPLLQQLAALTALTHLALSFSSYHLRDCDAPRARRVVPMLAPLPLRSLELRGNCYLKLRDMEMLAAALPSLEHLRITHFGGAESEAGALDALGPGQHSVWNMRNLAVLEVDPGMGHNDPLGASLVLALAAGCPTLQQLLPGHVSMDLRKAHQHSSVPVWDAGVVRRWVEGLGALAARQVLAPTAKVQLTLDSAAQAEAMCAALEGLQPERHRGALVGRINLLHAEGVADEAALGRLAACLPYVWHAKCDFIAFLALAQLRSVSQAFVAPRHRAWPHADAHAYAVLPTEAEARSALASFALRRLATLGREAAAARVRVDIMVGSPTHGWLNTTVQGRVVMSRR